MAIVKVGTNNNIYTAAFNAAAKTLTLSKIINFDMQIDNLISVYDVTVSLPFVFTGMTFSKVMVGAYPTYVWTFLSVPAGSANTDTLDIMIQIPDNYLNYSVLQSIATATV